MAAILPQPQVADNVAGAIRPQLRYHDNYGCRAIPHYARDLHSSEVRMLSNLILKTYTRHWCSLSDQRVTGDQLLSSHGLHFKPYYDPGDLMDSYARWLRGYRCIRSTRVRGISPSLF